MKAFAIGRLVFSFSALARTWGWVGNVNSPYRWRLMAGPFCLGWLRPDWKTPIILPRQARRALARGKTVHVQGFEHRRAR